MNRKQRRSTTAQAKTQTPSPDTLAADATRAHAAGQFQAAVELYDRLLALKPDYVEVYNNRGVALQALSRWEEAIQSFDAGIARKPDNAEALHNKSIALQALLRYPEAYEASSKALELLPDSPVILASQGASLDAMKRYAEALVCYDRSAALMPEAQTFNHRGNVLLRLNRYDDALTSYERAIDLKPGYAQAYNNKSVVLQEMGRFDEALASSDTSVALNPSSAMAHNTRAAALHKVKRYDEALASADIAIKLQPDYAGAYHNRGLVMLAKGKMAESEAMFRKALSLKPDFTDPLSNLVSIRKYTTPDADEVLQIRTLLGKPDVPDGDREYLLFALGKVYDDCGMWDEAFASYREANEIRNRSVSYTPQAVEQFTDSIITFFSDDYFAHTPSFKVSDAAPVFVIGMPRSGTTLMASILSNHPQMRSAGELPTLNAIAGDITPYPEGLSQRDETQAQGFAERYVQQLRRDVATDIPYVIDKHPLNFRHLGLIAQLFPKAKIIHCTRDAMDTALSNYFQRFTLYYDYSFDLKNISHFMQQYDRLMAHWRNVLPIEICDVAYEDMTAHTEQAARKALDYLGLKWDAKCLSPHTNPTPIETASSWQVRQPVYTRSVERWRHYEKWLGELKTL